MAGTNCQLVDGSLVYTCPWWSGCAARRSVSRSRYSPFSRVRDVVFGGCRRYRRR